MQEEIPYSVNGRTVIKARKDHLRKEKEIDQAVLKVKLKETKQHIDDRNEELALLPAPDWAHTKRNLWSSIAAMFVALLIGVGFILFAEYSLTLIGFDWGRWKLLGASFVFWLGTVVAIHIYLAREKATELSDLPRPLKTIPLLLCIIGLVVLAIARGLRPVLDVDPDSFEFLGFVASASGLIAQLTLSLALDLGSGVFGWLGSHQFSQTLPIFRTYKEIHRLTNDLEDIEERLAVLSVELNDSAPTGPNPERDLSPQPDVVRANSGESHAKAAGA